jgi:hypothetical protein
MKMWGVQSMNICLNGTILPMCKDQVIGPVYAQDAWTRCLTLTEAQISPKHTKKEKPHQYDCSLSSLIMLQRVQCL